MAWMPIQSRGREQFTQGLCQVSLDLDCRRFQSCKPAAQGCLTQAVCLLQTPWESGKGLALTQFLVLSSWAHTRAGSPAHAYVIPAMGEAEAGGSL